jgi:hypothetical protein
MYQNCRDGPRHTPRHVVTEFSIRDKLLGRKSLVAGRILSVSHRFGNTARFAAGNCGPIRSNNCRVGPDNRAAI